MGKKRAEVAIVHLPPKTLFSGWRDTVGFEICIFFEKDWAKGLDRLPGNFVI